VRSIDRLLQARRTRVLRIDDLSRLKVPLRNVLPFVTVPGHGVGVDRLDGADLAARLRPPPRQRSLFDAPVCDTAGSDG
jgi:predicted DNA-binding helix-hairpin-helix protein